VKTNQNSLFLFR